MSKRPHRWARVLRVPEQPQVVPRELLVALASEAPAVQATAAKQVAVDPRPGGSSVVDRARRYLAKLPPAVQGQDGSGRTFAAACALVVGFGLSIEAATPLLAEYSDRCEPPWTEPELAHKLADARRKAEEEPGRVGRLLARHRVPTT